MNVYFPNLNGVRAIAAFMVIFFHVELIKREFNLPNVERILTLGGDLGVTLFFVLSGFLITYLLITEQNVAGEISIKNFYARRILRIWPLYLIICILGLFVIPYCGSLFFEPAYSTPIITDKTIVSVLYFLFLSTVLTGTDSHVNFLRPTWSVSVEEQFYLIWPILMKKMFGKRPFISYFLCIYIAVRIIFGILSHKFFADRFPIFTSINSTLYYTPFDSLCIGALAAILLYRYRNNGSYTYLFQVLFNKKNQYSILALLPVFIYFFTIKISIIFFHAVHVDFTKMIYSILFAIVILNLAGNPSVVINLENSILKFFGKISYGLYLYHWFAIVFVLNLLLKFNIYNDILLYCISLGLTIGVASLSYYLIELRFLNFKHRFSKILSGDFVNK
jgi:peptidoglycan/LPS O-acetylase OafA/YrhL